MVFIGIRPEVYTGFLAQNAAEQCIESLRGVDSGTDSCGSDCQFLQIGQSIENLML